MIQKQFKIIFPNKSSFHVFNILIKKYKPIGNRVFDLEIVSVMLSKKIKNLFTINVKDFKDVEEITLLD